MPYRGRYFLGDEIPLGCLCVNSSGVPAVPDACPQLEIYSPSAKVKGGWLPGGLAGSGSGIPVLDRYKATGLFQVRLLLNGAFAPGQYQATYRWTIGAFNGMEQDTFEVLAGGDAKGSAISMDYYRPPHAAFLVRQLDSGQLVANRNPIA